LPHAATAARASQTKRGWNRVVVEKPFGTDSASSAKLAQDLQRYFSEDMVRGRVWRREAGRASGLLLQSPRPRVAYLLAARP
jgi:hypothetical protein